MSDHRDQTAPPRHLVSVVIPCYNEQDRLNTEAITSFLSERPLARVVFVDDASTDHTFARVTGVAGRLPDQVDVVRLGRNVGKAEAVRAGIQRSLDARPEFVAYWDADLSTPLEDLDRLITHANQIPDAIIISVSRTLMARAERSQSKARFIMSRLFARPAGTLTGGLSDPQNGAKLLRNGPWLDQATSYPFRTRWLLDIELINRARKYSPPEIDPERLFAEIPASSWQYKPGSHLKPIQVAIDIARYAPTAFWQCGKTNTLGAGADA